MRVYAEARTLRHGGAQIPSSHEPQDYEGAIPWIPKTSMQVRGIRYQADTRMILDLSFYRHAPAIIPNGSYVKSTKIYAKHQVFF